MRDVNHESSRQHFEAKTLIPQRRDELNLVFAIPHKPLVVKGSGRGQGQDDVRLVAQSLEAINIVGLLGFEPALGIGRGMSVKSPA